MARFVVNTLNKSKIAKESADIFPSTSAGVYMKGSMSAKTLRYQIKTVCAAM